MITVKLVGGIGNQMFQYAAARSLASQLKSPLQLDVLSFENFDDRNFDLHVFPDITEGFCDKAQHELLYSKSKLVKLRRKIQGIQIYQESHFHFDPEFFHLSAPVNLTGFFQSEKYFLNCEDEIRNRFKWEESGLSDKTMAYLASINDSVAVSVHFRRGDYVSNKKTNDFHGACDRAYYQKAIDFLVEKIPASHFFVFSDDIDWVRNEQYFSGIEHTYVEKTADMHDSEEMFLMSRCQHNIIANSSFSWWGAWLNNAADKIIAAPQNWFKDSSNDTSDLIPENWIRF